jgi:hypothetical protein
MSQPMSEDELMRLGNRDGGSKRLKNEAELWRLCALKAAERIEQLQAERDRLLEEKLAAFNHGVEAAAVIVELHCCISSCCDAQPASDEAKSLANCVRKVKAHAAVAAAEGDK